MRGPIPLVAFPISIPTPIPIPSTQFRSIVIWDIKTGIVIKDIVVDIWGLRRIVFSGSQTITLVTDYFRVFRTYDVLEGTLVSKGEILPRFDRWLGAYWAHEDSLHFATSFKTDGKLVIDVHEHQPPSTRLFPVVESFLVQLHGGEFSFSPVSFHASFVTNTKIAILDVRTSKILLHPTASQRLYGPPGHFSPDGRFFACGTLEGDIFVWRNTSAGYVPWSSLSPRLPFDWFSFSPTATSIFTWGSWGIQLLDIHHNFSSPEKVLSRCSHKNHLVAYSKHGAHIATARRGDNVLAVHRPFSDAPQQFTSQKRILDRGIVDVRFSPYDHRLCVVLRGDSYEDQDGVPNYIFLEPVEDCHIVGVTEGFIEGGWSRDGLFSPHGYAIRRESSWVEDSKGSKLLWLPPSWRMTCCSGARWNNNFLAFVDGCHPDPIILEFKPKTLLSHPY